MFSTPHTVQKTDERPNVLHTSKMTDLDLPIPGQGSFTIILGFRDTRGETLWATTAWTSASEATGRRGL